jgi:hypothetical protein
MKKIIILFIIILTNVNAQNAAELLKTIDSFQYLISERGIQDLVVEMEDPLLLKRMNEQMYMGRIQKLSFRFYWTKEPERIDVEVIGLPEGFFEIKQQLKNMVLAKFENILPLSFERKFKGYNAKIIPGKPNLISLVDEKGIQAIPEFHIQFKDKYQVTEIKMLKPIGTGSLSMDQEIKDWSNGRWVTLNKNSSTVDNGISVVSKTEYKYALIKGFGLPITAKTKTTISSTLSRKSKSQTEIEELSFGQYKINEGVALRWFVGIDPKTK